MYIVTSAPRNHPWAGDIAIPRRLLSFVSGCTQLATL